VAATWSPHKNRATDAPYTVFSGSTPLTTVDVNQELAPNDFSDDGVNWEKLGTFTITSNTLRVQLSNAANEYVIADAIRIERLQA
jgi:trimeric autotransporter adhesin